MPYKKGESGNPGGRPKSLSEWRNSPAAKKYREASYALLEDAVTTGFLAYRLPSGDLRHAKVEPRDRIGAARELINRIDGMPPQPITGEGGGPVKVDASAELFDKIKRLADEFDDGEAKS